jgi:hypothetical protein
MISWNISQKSVVLDFLWCPRQAGGWDYVMEGVSLVGMRWFGGSCNMQILLTERVAKTVGSEVPWDLVLQVCRVVLDPYSVTWTDVAGLQAATFNARIVEESVQRARVATKFLPANNRVALLIGDAAQSAYYRLGIGVNSALNAQPLLAFFLRGLASSPRRDWPRLVQRKAAVDDLRLQRIMRYQSQTMWLHSVCDFVVYFETPAEEDEFSKQYDELGYPRPYDRTPTFMVYQYEHNLRIREPHAMTAKEALERCFLLTVRGRVQLLLANIPFSLTGPPS